MFNAAFAITQARYLPGEIKALVTQSVDSAGRTPATSPSLRGAERAIAHDQADRAFYNRSSDSIHLPPKHAFKDAASYYGTALHEAAHNADFRIMPRGPDDN